MSARRQQGSSRQIVQLLMSGYPARRSLFADKAVLAAGIHQRSTTAFVRGTKVQTETECYSHAYRPIIIIFSIFKNIHCLFFEASKMMA